LKKKRRKKFIKIHKKNHVEKHFKEKNYITKISTNSILKKIDKFLINSILKKSTKII